jgi:hypothetical protein
MALYSQYRVLPCPIACDTLLLCYNPYFDVQFKQCYSLQELLSLLQDAPPTHRTLLLADTFEAGTELIAKVDRLRAEGEGREWRAESEGAEAGVEAVNDRLFQLAEQLVQPSQHKSSFLHLKCLLNKTDGRINSLTSQIKTREVHPRGVRVDKRTQKQLKVQEKEQRLQERQLKELECARENLRK